MLVLRVQQKKTILTLFLLKYQAIGMIEWESRLKGRKIRSPIFPLCQIFAPSPSRNDPWENGRYEDSKKGISPIKRERKELREKRERRRLELSS